MSQSKNYKPIIIVSGEPKSIFYEIFFKSLKKNKFKSPLILISSLKILKKEMKKFQIRKEINLIDILSLKKKRIDNKKINLINVNLKNNEKNYIKDCFDLAFKILKKNFTNKLLNGPIDKTKFLEKKFLGMTEYISKKFSIKNYAMLLYNKDISVCPLTTHLPLKLVPQSINQKLIKQKIKLISDFYIQKIGFKPKIAVTGLNPHCESNLKINEDIKIIYPAVKFLKKRGYKIDGPFPADTIFLKQNRLKYDVVIGMYHDQILSSFKTLKEYDAINITLGLPFYRVSPDHGPNISMINKNSSNPLSLIRALKFLDQK